MDIDRIVLIAQIAFWPLALLAAAAVGLSLEQFGAFRCARLRAVNCWADRYLPSSSARARHRQRAQIDAQRAGGDIDDDNHLPPHFREPNDNASAPAGTALPRGQRSFFGRHLARAPLDQDVRRLWGLLATAVLVTALLVWPTSSEAGLPALIWAGVKIVTWAAQAAAGVYILYEGYKAAAAGASGDAALTPLIVDMLAQLQAVRSGFGMEAYRYLGAAMAKLFPILAVLFMLWQAGKMMLFPDTAKECLGKMIGRWPLITVVGMLLAWPALYHDYVIALIEGLALSIGGLFINVGYALPGLMGKTAIALPAAPQAGVSYAYLGALMTNSISDVIDIAFLMMTSGWGAVFGGALAGLLLLLPYTFVVGVFLAFLVESMFKVMAMWAVTPLLLCGTLFDSCKSFWIASLRVMLSAGLTVIFARAAMGFTVGVVEQNRAKIVCAVVGMEHKKCTALHAGSTSEKAITEEAVAKIKEEGNVPGLPIGGSAYYYTLILGFVSVLLHLKAASLASNISGANDGAGPAAAVVMVGQGALGMLSTGLMKAATSRTGLGKRAFGGDNGGEMSPDFSEKMKASMRARMAGNPPE